MAKLKHNIADSGFVFAPEASTIQCWDLLLLAVVLALVPVLPLLAAFEPVAPLQRVVAFEVFCDVILVLDLFKNFLVGYVDADEELHMDAREIAYNYASGWLWPDLLAVAGVILGRVDAVAGWSDAFRQGLRFLKVCKLFRLFNLLRVVSPYWYRVQDYYHVHVSDAWIKLSKLFVVLLVLGHWMGCLTFMARRRRGNLCSSARVEERFFLSLHNTRGTAMPRRASRNGFLVVT